MNIVIVRPKKQVGHAPPLHRPALLADASMSQFSLFGSVMDTSAQIKQLQVAQHSVCSVLPILMPVPVWCSSKVVFGG